MNRVNTEERTYEYVYIVLCIHLGGKNQIKFVAGSAAIILLVVFAIAAHLHVGICSKAMFGDNLTCLCYKSYRRLENTCYVNYNFIVGP